MKRAYRRIRRHRGSGIPASLRSARWPRSRPPKPRSSGRARNTWIMRARTSEPAAMPFDNETRPAAHPDRAAMHPPCLGGGGADLPHRRYIGVGKGWPADRPRLPQSRGDQYPSRPAARPHRHRRAARTLREPCRVCRRAARVTPRSNPCRADDDPALLPARNGGDLVAGDALPHLVRDRGACRRRHGRARHHPEGGRADHLGEGQERDLRRRAHRRDRARDQARRHRLPDPSGRDRRARGALRASGHDLVRRARHLLQRAAHARRRHPDRRRRQAARRAEAPRLRAQDDADHRPHPRHPCRADDLRAQARAGLCGVRARQANG